jgi:hypothetical protein
VLRAQLDDQRKASAAQAEVFELQAAELRDSLEERKREAERRYRAQASAVFVAQQFLQEGTLLPGASNGVAGPAVTAYVRNTSGQPVYDAELYWRRGSAGWGEPNPEPLGTVMPATEIARTREFSRDTNMDVSGAVLRFTDAAGVRWVRRPDGYLGEQA